MDVKSLKRYIGRKDVYAKQTDKGSYICVREPITDELLDKHLKGEITIGTYLIRKDGLINFAAIDLDGEKTDLVSLKRISIAIYSLFPDFTRTLEFSGRRGYHIWIFPETPYKPSILRMIIKSRLKRIGIGGSIEIYPKQNKLSGSELGNQIKLPCGKHKKGGWSTIIK